LKDNQLFFNIQERYLLNAEIKDTLRFFGFPQEITDYNLKKWSNEKQKYLEY